MDTAAAAAADAASPSPSPARLLGEIKAARAEVIRLQHELRRFGREHARQFDAVRCLVEQQSLSGQAQGHAGHTLSSPGHASQGHAACQEAAAPGARSADDDGDGAAAGAAVAEGESEEELHAPSLPASSLSSRVAAATGLVPIGRLSSCFVRLNGTPRNAGGLCSHARAVLKLSCNEAASAADGLAEFSHVWVLFGFHRNKKVAGAAKPKVAPPKLGGACVPFLTPPCSCLALEEDICPMSDLK